MWEPLPAPSELWAAASWGHIGDGFPSWASKQHEAPGSLPQFALAR